MNSLIFEQVFQQKEDFLPILLLADDGPHLENYLENGDLFTLSLKNGKTVACAVVIKKQKNTCLHKIKKLGDLIYINPTFINKKYQMLLTKKS